MLPPLDDKALNDKKAMYTAIARALDTWAVVEGHLCSIFAVAVGAKEYPPAAAAFSAILSFEAQIDMVHAAMGRRFAPNSSTYIQWKNIRKKLDKLRPIRNKLAHGKVIPIALKDGARAWRYLPFFHFYTEKERREFVHISEKDMRAIDREFFRMVVTMADFGQEIGAFRPVRGSKSWI